MNFLRVYKNMLKHSGQPFCFFGVYLVYVLVFGLEHRECFCTLSHSEIRLMVFLCLAMSIHCQQYTFNAVEVWGKTTDLD